ncbi:unnamed protein product [Brachionus calyciflorus]|uniref:Integrase catalytic domain-containing protein n=1 Tax=Brachionus calyciflorus TaxID=104777 RepID=A0A813PI63_9BILA|nr:unnamed protein product [Brachionus calyciflorus]
MILSTDACEYGYCAVLEQIIDEIYYPIAYFSKTELLYLTPCQTNQIVTTDFAGPFKTTIRGSKFLKIIVDHFTKFLLFCPSKNAKAHTTASNIVDEWVYEYGILEAILSNGGKHFQSKLTELVYEYLDIRRLKTTPYHPQCDGLSERGIRTFKNMIQSYINVDQTTWDIHCKFTFAYNTSLHSNKQGEVVVLEDVQGTIGANTPEVAKNYLRDLIDKLELSYKIAEKNRDLKMEKSKIDFDRHIKKLEYKIGDLVLCDHPKLKKGLSQGVARKFYGPFEVVGKNENNVDYLIRLASKPKSKIKQIHKNRLKIYFKSRLYNLQFKQEPESDC